VQFILILGVEHLVSEESKGTEGKRSISARDSELTWRRVGGEIGAISQFGELDTLERKSDEESSPS
jgi:hypothetical protein